MNQYPPQGQPPVYPPQPPYGNPYGNAPYPPQYGGGWGNSAPYGQPYQAHPQYPPYGQPYSGQSYGYGSPPPYGAPPNSYAPPRAPYLPAGRAPFAPPAAPPPKDPKKTEKRRRYIVGSSIAVIALCVAVTLVAVFAFPAPPAVSNYAPGEAPTVTIHDQPELEDDGISTAEIAKKTRTSVVSLKGYQTGNLFSHVNGSGIIMSEDGFIITNAHVLEGFDTFTVSLSDDETEYSARVVGADPATDLAVVRIDAENLVPAEFGDSALVQIGERCVAIGNSYGMFPGSVTQGIVSGLGRRMDFDDGMSTINLIQTDTAINPGNSGGALINRFGQVIGITSSKVGDIDIEGLCFAIPINDAKPVLENLINYGYVKDRAALGVTVVPLNSVNGPSNALPAQGLYIQTVEEYSDLINYDVMPGDVILKAGGQVMNVPLDLVNLIKSCAPGDNLELEIMRPDTGRVITITAQLVASPQQ